MAFYFFYGQEEYDIEKAVNEIREKYLDKNFASMNYRYFAAPEYKELLNILCTTGTMFGHIINVINCDKYIFDSKYTLTDEQIDNIEKNLQNSSDNVHNIFTLTIPRDTRNKDIPKIYSKKLCKVLIKNTQSKEFKQYWESDKELPNRIIKIAKEKGLFISTDMTKYLVDKIGVNLKLIDSQLEKLQLSIYPDTKVTQEMINQYLTRSENLYKILDYILARKNDMAIWEFRKNCENGHHYLEILAFLQTQISTCISVKTDIETMPLLEVALKNGMKKEYPAKLLLQKMSNLSVAELVKIKKNLIRAEEAIKKDYSSVSEIEIEKAILSDI